MELQALLDDSQPVVNCAHPTVHDCGMSAQLEAAPGLRQRVLGLNANTSTKRPEELDGSEVLETVPTDELAADLAHSRDRFGLRIVGGCRGTGTAHIEALAQHLLSGRDGG